MKKSMIGIKVSPKDRSDFEKTTKRLESIGIAEGLSGATRFAMRVLSKMTTDELKEIAFREVA